jgi:hypothetical protein
MSNGGVCAGCGHQNSPARQTCKRCGRRLDGAADDASPAVVARQRGDGGLARLLLWGCLGLVAATVVFAGVSGWLVWQEVQSALRSIPEEDLREAARVAATAVAEFATAVPSLVPGTPTPVR